MKDESERGRGEGTMGLVREQGGMATGETE